MCLLVKIFLARFAMRSLDKSDVRWCHCGQTAHGGSQACLVYIPDGAMYIVSGCQRAVNSSRTVLVKVCNSFIACHHHPARRTNMDVRVFVNAPAQT